MSENSTESTQSEKPVIERGGYSAGALTASELPPPPPSVSVTDNDQGTASEQQSAATSPKGSE